MNDFTAEQDAIAGKLKALAGVFASNLQAARDTGELGQELGKEGRRVLAEYVGPQARALLASLARLQASLKAKGLPPFESEYLQDVQDAAKQ